MSYRLTFPSPTKTKLFRTIAVRHHEIKTLRASRRDPSLFRLFKKMVHITRGSSLSTRRLHPIVRQESRIEVCLLRLPLTSSHSRRAAAVDIDRMVWLILGSPSRRRWTSLDVPLSSDGGTSWDDVCVVSIDDGLRVNVCDFGCCYCRQRVVDTIIFHN